ncbi:DUF3592 domain-containing protein [Chondrinema litorale]|uniref:DUF3592 domain-containing protein n=1 Tax=Chondrinema litorale TaxID=2994555 RepID=UPI00254350EB|nr:DUF3592 domain-containing protein [Chondrinema litorale]UZR96161.1 DUF3592 domain-containing protein [Chondrinema litorale]
MIILLLPFLLAGITLFYMGYSELEEEKDFLLTAIKTEGEVVGVLDVIVEREYDEDGDIAIGGYLNVAPIVQFETRDGYLYKVRSKKTYDKLPATHFEVWYNPKDPTDVMIDNYYLISNYQKYSQFYGGIGLIMLFFGILIYTSIA